MYNITFVCTIHKECGKCNSLELHRIIESISPEIIFEELSPSFFDKYYVTKIYKNLETDTIKKYIENCNIVHIPIGSRNIPSDSFANDVRYMYNRMESLTDINGYNYRIFDAKNSMYAGMYGFQYLNSIHCIDVQNKIDVAIEKCLQKINDEKLYQIYKLWKDSNNKRENEMLQNIYNYSKENQYNQAIFFIGAGHRKSIIEKIEKYKTQENIKLNWIFYNNRSTESLKTD